MPKSPNQQHIQKSADSETFFFAGVKGLKVHGNVICIYTDIKNIFREQNRQ